MWFVLRAEICLKGKGLKCSLTLYTCSPKIDQEQQQIERGKRQRRATKKEREREGKIRVFL